MTDLDRRGFLGLAGASALGLAAAACSSSSKKSVPPAPKPTTTTADALSKPEAAPFDTVVLLMMENRSFDHFLGWLPGANGKQAGLSYADARGTTHPTHHLTDFQNCGSLDPKHDYQSVARQYNGGACDGFLRTQPVGDTFPIGYYAGTDLPVTAVLAQGHTVADNYHCSVLGPTGPNRMYAWSATTDYVEFNGIMNGQGQRPSNVQLAIFDRLQAAGISGLYYAGAEPQSYSYSSKKYDGITKTHDDFFAAAKAGTLPHVTFLDPDLDSIAETTGTATDDHPYGDVRRGENWIARVYDALVKSPQWDHMVFVLTFDEHGGFYDHVVPPRCRDDNTFPGPDFKRMGFRVPCIIGGPFAPARVVRSGPYEHCSILSMIEWRWNLEPMTARDKYANNLAHALDFSAQTPPVTLPTIPEYPAVQCTPAQIGKHISASA